MTLEESIVYYDKIAAENEKKAYMMGCQFVGSKMANKQNEYMNNATDYKQLSEWLRELKELRNSIGAVKLKDMKETVTLMHEILESKP